MSGRADSEIVMVCCSVFGPEVKQLAREHWPGIEVRYQPSMLHMEPCRLAQRLDEVVKAEVSKGRQVVLIYGDCCPSMVDLEAIAGVVRTRSQSCCDLLLGPEEYRRLMAEGVFFLIPEWARRWHEVFTAGLGLNDEEARNFMREMQRKLMYLDTGIIPVPHSELEACSQYCGLPYEIRQISLDPLRAAIDETIARLHQAGGAR